MKLRMVGMVAAGLVAVSLLLVLGLRVVADARSLHSPLVGRQAPNLVVRTFAGDEVRLSLLRGRPVILNFWASSCGPCRQEAGVLSEGARVHGGAASFLGVDVRDDEASARAFIDTVAPAYPVGIAVSGHTADYGVGSGLPLTFFVDARGTVVARSPGALDRLALEGYLKEMGG